MYVKRAKKNRHNNIKGCGGIITAKHNDTLYFLMGRDYRGALSDFGGKREKNESCLQCATREFYEETSGVFFSRKEVLRRFKETKEVIFFNTYMCYVINIEFDKTLPRQYREHKDYIISNNLPIPDGHLELHDMVWLSIDDLYKIHYTKKLIHNRTRYILKKFFKKHNNLLKHNNSSIPIKIPLKTYTPVISSIHVSSKYHIPTISL